MKAAKKLMSFLAVLAMAVVFLGVAECQAADVQYKGKDGDLKWTIDTEGHMEITGEGNFEKRADLFSNPLSTIGWHKYRNKVKSVTVNVSYIGSTAAMFSGFSNLKSVDFTNFDTSYVTDMSYMFYGCKSLVNIDISSFDTSNVRRMHSMFEKCEKLKSINVRNLDVRNVDTMFYMFMDCYNLEELDLSTWKIKGEALIGGLCQNCEKMKVLNIKNHDFDDDPGASINFIAGTYSLEKLVAENSEYVVMDLSSTNKKGKYVYIWKYKNGAHYRLDLLGKRKNTVFKDSKSGGRYIVTAEGYKKRSGFKEKNPQVTYYEPINKNKRSVSIPATVKYKGVTYEVTSISKNAFKNNTKVKKITIGASVKKIGSKAFMNCKKLTKIVVKGQKLTVVGKNALSGVNEKCNIKVPSSKYSAYKKLFKGKGQKKTVKVVR